MTELIMRLLDGFNVLVLVYFIIINTSYMALTFIAYKQLRRYTRRLKSIHVDELVAAAGAPPVTLIAPAYNEEATCVEAVRSLLTLEYEEYEILVVNDGSRDRTMEVMIEAYDFIPATRMPTAHIPTARARAIYRSRHHTNLWLVDKENGGKADALNAGINLCRTPYFCGMDADTLLERDSLARAIRPFLEDGRTIAAGGIIRIVNGCSVKHGVVTDVKLPPSNVASMQVLEYLRAFLSARMGWSSLDAMLIISGAFGVFRRSAVVEVGGYYTDTVGEDMELIVRLHRYHLENKIPYRVAFVPDPVAWTECPESLAVLGRQRDRWQRGLYQSLLRHKVMMMNPRYGRVGMLAFPYFFFLEMLGPLVEVVGYLTFAIAFVLGRYDLHHAGAFVAVAILFGIANSIAAVGLEELTFRRYSRLRDLLRLMWLGVAENFGYRQLSMYWRLRGLLSARKAGKGWGAMVRKGFGTPGTTALIVIGLLFAGVQQGRAQDVRWRAALHTHYEFFSGNQGPWSDWLTTGVDVERKTAKGAIIGSFIEARRFDRDNVAMALDVYRELSARTYINARVQIAPAANVLPRSDLSAELFRVIATGWEASAGYRRLGYANSDVDLISAGIARYIGNWYVRPRLTIVMQDAEEAYNASLVVRRYLGESFEFAEVSVSGGEEMTLLGAEPVVELRSTSNAAVRLQRRISGNLGGMASLTYTRFSGIPDRPGIQLGGFVTW